MSRERLTKAPAEPLYKLLRDGKSRNAYAYSLPTEASGTWTPGNWQEVKGELVRCANGLHVTTDPNEFIYHTDEEAPEVYLVETEGDVLVTAGTTEVVASKLRLTKRLSHAEMGVLGLVGREGPPPATPLYVVTNDDDRFRLPTKAGRAWTPGAWATGTALRLLTTPPKAARDEAPDVYIAEARGDVAYPKVSTSHDKVVLAKEARLVRKLSWVEMRKLGIVKGVRPVVDRGSPVIAFLRFLVGKSKTSERKLGYAVTRAIKAAVYASMKFAIDDFAVIERAGALGLWCAGAGGGEFLYGFLVREKHESALRSFESWMGRTPWVVRGDRLYEGTSFWWKRGKDGAHWTVTGFDDVAGTMRAVTHRETKKAAPGYRRKLDGEFEYVRTIGQRATFTHAVIDGAEAARVLSVRTSNDAKKITDGLARLPDYQSGGYKVAVEQVVRWTAAQRAEVFAYLKMVEKRNGNSGRPAPPAFVLATVAELDRFVERHDCLRAVQKAKHKAAGGAGYAWDVKVTDAEVDAEEARRLARKTAAA